MPQGMRQTDAQETFIAIPPCLLSVGLYQLYHKLTSTPQTHARILLTCPTKYLHLTQRPLLHIFPAVLAPMLLACVAACVTYALLCTITCTCNFPTKQTRPCRERLRL